MRFCDLRPLRRRGERIKNNQSLNGSVSAGLGGIRESHNGGGRARRDRGERNGGPVGTGGVAGGGNSLPVEELSGRHGNRPVGGVHQVVDVLAVLVGQGILAPPETANQSPSGQRKKRRRARHRERRQARSLYKTKIPTKQKGTETVLTQL